jgi:hypothetical protein
MEILLNPTKIVGVLLTYGRMQLSILFVDLQAIRATYMRPDAFGCPERCSVCCLA